MDVGNKCSMEKEDILKNLTEGLKSENEAKVLCEEIVGLLEDENDKAMVNKIIADEEKHIKITEKLMEVVNSSYTGKTE